MQSEGRCNLRLEHVSHVRAGEGFFTLTRASFIYPESDIVRFTFERDHTVCPVHGGFKWGQDLRLRNLASVLIAQMRDD